MMGYLPITSGCIMPKSHCFNTPELIHGLRERDCRVWESVYEEQWGPLCRFIQARLDDHTNSQVDSEDLAQEVLCRAYMGIGRFRGDAHLGTWLRGIAQHVILEAA